MWSRNSPAPYLEQTPSSDCAGRVFFQCPGCKSAQDRMSWNCPHHLFWGPKMKTIIVLLSADHQFTLSTSFRQKTKSLSGLFYGAFSKMKNKIKVINWAAKQKWIYSLSLFVNSYQPSQWFSFSLQEAVIDKGHICPTSTRTTHPQCRGDEKRRNLDLATIWRTKMLLPESSGRKAMASERLQQREKLRKMKMKSEGEVLVWEAARSKMLPFSLRLAKRREKEKRWRTA